MLKNDKNSLFILTVVVTALFLTPSVYGENIRGLVKGKAVYNSEKNIFEDNEISFAVEDLGAIEIPSTNGLIEGIEIVLEIPQALNKYRNSFSFHIYNNVSPIPSDNITSYRGQQVFMRLIPVTSTLYIKIPLNQNSGMTQELNTYVLPKPILQSEMPLLLTIQPVAKALPDRIYNENFKMKIKPIFSNRGILKLNIEGIDNYEEFKVFIDSKQIDWPQNSNIILDAGLHTFSLIHKQSEVETMNIAIEPGSTEELNYTFRPMNSEVVIAGDIKADVYIDNSEEKLIPGTPVTLQPGQHSVLFKVGDNIVTKMFTVNPGESIELSLFLDIIVQKR